MDWQAFIAIGALVISAFTILSRSLDKGLSIREHDEYRKGAERTTDGLQDQFRRELDKVEGRVAVLEQTRPTAAQLQESTANLKEQLNELKRNIKQSTL